MKIFNSTIRNSGLATFLLGMSAAVGAAELSLPDEPLFLGGGVPPNVMFIKDDSGSMHRESMPDSIGALPFASLPANVQSTYGRYWAAYSFPRLVNGMYGSRGSNGALDKTNVSPDFSRRNIFGSIHRSASQNAIYYDPNKTYQPWSNADGSLMQDADPDCAPHNPSLYPVSDSLVCDVNTRSLTSYNSNESYWWRAEQIICDEYADKDNDGEVDAGDAGKREPRGILLGCDTGAARGYDMYFRHATDRFYPAHYVQFTDGGAGDYASAALNPANYEHRYITPTGLVSFDSNNSRSISPSFPQSGSREDCASVSFCTYQEEIQNFANWYSYHRSRLLLARAGIGRAFAELGDNLNVGFGTLNTTAAEAGQDVIILPVEKFDTAGKQQFFDTLYNLEVPENGTPLRRALQTAGQYFEDASATGPWADDNGDISECRQSYTILMSDGVWNGGNPSFPSGNNIDDINGPTITGPGGESFQYTPEPPYSDNHSSTLADVAMHYWNRDLLPGVANSVKTSDKDPAFWQHMTTFTVGLGVSGELPFPDSFDALEDGSLAWPNPLASRLNRIDDMWHAAINGRGQFLSAADGESFANALIETLRDIGERQGSSGSAAANSGSVGTDTRVYQASFDTEDGSGDVRALPADTICGAAGSQRLCGTEIWSAADRLDAQNFLTGREIITFDPASGNGVPFTQADLPPALNSFTAEELAFLRGDRSEEGITLRQRSTVLGDVVDASPRFEGIPSRIRTPLTWEDNLYPAASNPETAYANFRSAQSGRTPMLFVGANDGMMHVLNAETGDELLGYIPNAVLSDIGQLADPDYSHRFFVNAPPSTTDTFYGGSWHTTLVGGLGKGGQAVYALDVTGGAGFFDESRAADLVLWEFTDPDLGYLYGKPEIVRLHNGRWAAIFGNGYNATEADGSASATGTASLFIIDIETGAELAQIDTKVGSVASPNGISQVSPIDIDGDFITDYVYAGDLQGNMWKFDLTAAAPADWDIGFGSTTTPEPLFTAVDDNGTAQPITAAARVRQHPFGLDYGVIVYFGTGKFVESTDALPDTSVTQSFYGIWDIDVISLGPPNGFTPPATRNGYSRANLQEQEILAEISSGDNRLRIVTDNPTGTRHLDWLGGTRGFYMDLKISGSASAGEMVVSEPALRGELLLFNTFTPDGDDCDAAPSSFLMAVDAATGGRLFVPPFDLNDDNDFNTEDQVTFNGDEVNVSGIATGDATLGGGVFLVDGDSDLALINRIDGVVQPTRTNRAERNGRRAWRELRR